MPFTRLFALCLLALSLMACGSSGGSSSPQPEPEPEPQPEPEPTPEPSALVPFVLPWDDGSSGITHMGARLNHTPAGQYGALTVNSDGHFSLNNERVRFWGVNITGDSSFPTREEAEAIAQRLSKFGVNLVRFHHMDNNWGGLSLIDYDRGHSRNLNTEALERLDYFVQQLKNQGIYINFNLINAREFQPADGLPEAITEMEWKERHVLGFFMPVMRELEKEYALKLLSHTNDYTGLTYAEDPAIAFVEINNENSLFQQYYDGSLNAWPDSIQAPLQAQWNSWLAARYEDTQALEQGWGAIDEPLGEELLTNGDFAAGLNGWRLEEHEGAQASASTGTFESRTGVSLRVEQSGAESWHVQFNQGGLAIEENQLYTLSLSLHSNELSNLSVHLQENYAPNWAVLENWPLEPTGEWQTIHITFAGPRDDNDLRLNVSGLGTQTGTLYLANFSLRPGGTLGQLPEGQNLEEGTIALNTLNGNYTLERKREWMDFLRSQERDYWADMHQYIKNQLNFNGLVTGTQLMNSPPSVQNEFPFIDAHAYWQHPIFPGEDWDPDHWIVRNDPMTLTFDNTIPSLAGQRVAGKPFTVSEYQHSSPNTYSSEGPLLIAAYAALQDWDGVYLFAYDAGRDGWSTDYIENFFSMTAHPTKMAHMALGANLFRRGDVSSAQQEIALNFSAERELDILAQEGNAWNVANASHLEPNPRLAFEHRLALDLSNQGVSQPPEIENRDVQSDTGELHWDRSGLVTIDTVHSKTLVGFVEEGQRVEFDQGVSLTMGATLQDWASVGLTLQEGRFDQPSNGGRLLVVTTGLVENTDMEWVSEEQESLGSNWGRGPTLVEVVPVTLELPYPSERLTAWSLDELGQRDEVITIEPDGNGSRIILGGDASTLWYEIDIEAH